MTHPIYSPVFE